MSIPDKFLTADQAAEITGAHPDTIRDACRRGHIKAGKRGRTWMIRREAIDQWIEGDAA